MERIQSYATKLERLNDDCVQYSMKHCIPKNKYEGTQRLEDLFVPFAPLTVTEQYPIAYMDIGEFHEDHNNDENRESEAHEDHEVDDEDKINEDEDDVDEIQEDVCSEEMIDRLIGAVEVKQKKANKTKTNKTNKTKKSIKQPKNKSKKK